MARLRQLCTWVVVLTLVLASPVASLGECLRCPPDCPMHLRAAEADADGAHGAHAGHGAHAVQRDAIDAATVHADHQPSVVDAHAHHGSGVQHGESAPEQRADGGAKRCHQTSDDAAPAPPIDPADGPCISGTCGHMDFSLARVIPDGVLSRPGALAPVLIAVTPAPSRDASHPVLPSAPPTEPPRALSA